MKSKQFSLLKKIDSFLTKLADTCAAKITILNKFYIVMAEVCSSFGQLLINYALFIINFDIFRLLL